MRLLFGIAALSGLLGLVYAWHTSPRRRVRIANRRAANASQRLDHAVAANFVGTTVGFDGTNTVEFNLDDDAGVDDEDVEEDDDDVRPNPRPRPRRPNDAPWDG